MPEFAKTRILVVGDIMLDRYWHGATERISPEAPVPVVKVSRQDDRPGGAANVALNTAALGASTHLLGLVGRDEAAQVLGARLQAAGVACDFTQTETEPTIMKLRAISRNQQLLRLDFEERFSSAYAPAIQASVAAQIADCDVLIISDYDKGTLSDVQSIIKLAKAHNKLVLVDPKGSDYRHYGGATLLTPNMAEFEAVVGKCHSEEQIISRGSALIKELGLDCLLITRSEKGMTLLHKQGSEVHFPARSHEVFDVTGAGDTVISTLAAALGAGEDMQNAVAIANMAAGIAIGKLGTYAIRGPEIRREIAANQRSARGVVSEEQLAIAIADARLAGEKIVFTNGCFDILHAGHVGYLEQARQLGQRLVVAINSDASVRRLKGEGRPINTEDRRMIVLSSLEAVDWVVCFDQPTPEHLLALIRPDILVKGGDYGIEGVVGGEFVRSYGGDVQVLSLLDNCSTTAIVEQIKGDERR
ncbi:MAG: bifunctional D-glycero-beta-D-manno-heptose-7-phosphate kinase/D-glycero-beta-D-manno-heptose 1-phosphate adenylyltransferase HldE [Oceanospirillaceae bacterium]|nr:bifunctional D-glycero-beta-D-manno-heptose-7-phosphate kinase/D-glycero-beta-D-manno-heptose 1-phosphate adenylyltransferase HldE [Oceanospirillaceae bacterium]